MYTWRAILWAMIQYKPMIYEHEDVVDVIAMRHAKNMDIFESKIENDKPKIWQLVSSITNWYIWKARCLKVSKM